MTPRHCVGTYPTGRKAGATTACLLALALGGCGERHRASPATAAPAARTAASALTKAPLRAGEIVVSGQASPAAHGPYSLHGRYLVRFEQVDPADPARTFSDQTTFVAYAAPAQDQAEGPGAVRIAHGASRTGTARVRLDGRLWLNVSFGDFPYALRLTPIGR